MIGRRGAGSLALFVDFVVGVVRGEGGRGAGVS